ncbi:MFS transporter [Mesorhizobium sp. BAC0120]|uniref:MFS transporter n=1 Tax=Mesorhizobium sp. BAC0120 TaxID=3090670 RepID=UPI00298BF78C|nr:MFS transporter [Mesorhizobium sp. BAC0120]MDW6023300.1 MFS transporter [Mesorhizobium sp. BAC0120]
MSSVRSIQFVRLWSGNTASGIATWALPFVLGFAVSRGVLSAVDLGIFLALRSVGFLVAVPIGGVMADRIGSRRIILASSLIAAGGTLLVCLDLALSAQATPLLTGAGVFFSGIGQGASRPVYQAIVPGIVSVTYLQTANAALSLSIRATILVGPAAATLIATMFGVAAAFLAIAILWALSAFLPPWPVEPPRQTSSAAQHSSYIRLFAEDFTEGYHEARRHPWFFAALAALCAVVATGYSVTNVLLPVISVDVFDSATLLVGSVTAYMLGALAGAVVVSHWNPIKRGWWGLVGLGSYALVPLSLLAAETFWMPMVAYALAGFGMELFNVIWFTAIQDGIVREKLARVSSLDFIISYGLAPLGLSVIAPLSTSVGIAPILIGTAIICMLAAILASMTPTAAEFRLK